MQRDFSQLNNRTFDLLICGGGIYGAWTAYDAALRGLDVALLDKGDWGCGTSSASSKLIHGGLRYLEALDFKLVRKSLLERQMLLKTAPHRIWPLKFGVPVYKDSRLNRLQLKVGLSIYDFLAESLAERDRHTYYNQDAFRLCFPAIKANGLKGGFTYLDAQTDDARLVLELVDGACNSGAVCLNYCEIIGLIEKNNRVIGATVIDKATNAETTVSAHQIVDTSGRWSANLRKTPADYRLAKGIHLLMPKLPHQDALLLTAKSDQRVFFVIPWYGLTLIGTTDSNYDGNLDKVDITPDEIAYLLNEANQALEKAHWTKDDIIGKFSGVRVLKPSHLDSPNKISRDWMLSEAQNGLLSSIGGKLTSAREDAAVIVDSVCLKLGKQTPCQTFGKAFPWLGQCDYKILLEESTLKARKLGIDEETALWLVRRHGTRVATVYDLCAENTALKEKIRPELPFLSAEIIFCAHNEMVIHLDDLLRRRLPLLIAAKLKRDEITRLASLAAGVLAWDGARTANEIDRCGQAIT